MCGLFRPESALYRDEFDEFIQECLRLLKVRQSRGIVKDAFVAHRIWEFDIKGIEHRLGFNRPRILRCEVRVVL